MVNKKNEINFFQGLSNFNFSKKNERDKKEVKEEEGRAQISFNCDTLILEPNNSTYLLSLSFILIDKLVI